jgi:hypothetical protein
MPHKITRLSYSAADRGEKAPVSKWQEGPRAQTAAFAGQYDGLTGFGNLLLTRAGVKMGRI